jgi:hypothetical protein
MLWKIQPVVAQDTSVWRVGIADVVITPTEPIWMAGFAGRKNPSQGVLNDLHAKALAIEDQAGTRLVILSTDLIAFPRSLRNEIAQSLRSQHQVPDEGFLMNCSHTHGGPVIVDDFEMDVLYPLTDEQQEVVKRYFASLKEKLKQVSDQAIRDLRPAKLGYSSARCGFAMNRRLPTKDSFANSPNPAGPVDHSVPVLRIDNLDGTLRAVMFGYACHNTSMVSDNYRITSDYAGFAQDHFEMAHKGVKAMFLMGCGGDQNAYPRGTEELSSLHGRALATAIDAALLPAAQPVIGPLRMALEDVPLAFDRMNKEQLLAEQASRDQYASRRGKLLLERLEVEGQLRPSYDFPLQVIRFGNSLTIVAFAGETVVDYALRAKRELKIGPVWVAGYCNDVFAYIPSERVLREGGYEGGGAMRYSVHPGPFSSGIEQTIFAKLDQLFQRSNPPVP